MSTPIEWTTKRPAEVTQRRGLIVEVREKQDQPRPGGWHIVDQKRATPADLIAALAAMPAEEREKVLLEFKKISAATAADAVARVEKAERRVNELLDNLGELASQRNRETIRANEAERERDRMAAEFGCCPGELPDDGEIARVVRERSEFRDRAEKAERALVGVAMQNSRELKELERVIDEERARAAKAERERDEAVALHKELADSLRSIHRSAIHERTVVAEEFDSLRTRLIAAESAAAALEPREYPLADGSRWIDNVIRDADGSQSWLAGGQVVTDGPWTGGLRYTYRQSARNLAALLAKGGLL